MAAPKGNSFWKLRAKHGRDKLFETPELLWDAACEYFEWVDNNPFVKTKTVVSEKSGILSEEIPTQRAYTRMAFYIFIGCSDKWMCNFKKICSDDFLTVIQRIENIIDNNQIEGAMSGHFKENLVSRLQGLAENNNNNNNNNNYDVTPLTKEELDAIDDEI